MLGWWDVGVLLALAILGAPILAVFGLLVIRRTETWVNRWLDKWVE